MKTYLICKLKSLLLKIRWNIVCGKYRIAKQRYASILSELARVKYTVRYRKKYKNQIFLIKQQIEQEFDSVEHNHAKIVWVCWFQGLENAPEVVKACYNSVKKHLYNYDIKLITAENYRDYCDLPTYIIDRYEKGQMCAAHFSDIIRLDLLNKYGGTWIDATCFLTDQLPGYMLESDLFMPQTVMWETGRIACRIENYFITACQNNRILLLAQKLLYQYWYKHKKADMYMLTYSFLEIAIEEYQTDWKKVIPFPRANMHLLLERLNDDYDDRLYQAILNCSPIHKLTHKSLDYNLYFTKKSTDNKSFYDIIINNI